MSKLKFILMAVFMVITSSAFISCGDDDETPNVETT